MVRILKLTFIAESGIRALALVTEYVPEIMRYPANFPVLFRARHTDYFV